MRFIPPTPEVRSISLENPAVSLTDPRAWSGMGSASFTGEEMSEQIAMGIPAFAACVDFISNEFASYPWMVFRKDGDNRVKATNDPLYPILHDAVNARTTSFNFRKTMMVNALSYGRAYAYIEKNKMGRVMNLWILDPHRVTIILNADMSLSYQYRPINGGEITYEQDEVIDIIWVPGPDGISHTPTVVRFKNTLGLSIGADRYASRTFQNGGLPPLVLSGNFSPATAEKASTEIQNAMRMATDTRRNVLAIDKNNELKAIGVDPSKNQLLELRGFQVNEIARFFGLPPTSIGDLTHATYSNLEMSDLNVIKHCLLHWCNRWEAECNLKFFGKQTSQRYCEFNMDGAMRGDFKTRMEGYAAGVMAGVWTSNEIRVRENLPLHAWGDNLCLQSGTAPIAGLVGAVDADGNVWETPDPISDDGEDDVVSDGEPNDSVPTQPAPAVEPNDGANAIVS